MNVDRAKFNTVCPVLITIQFNKASNEKCFLSSQIFSYRHPPDIFSFVDIPAVGVYFVLYENMLKWFNERKRYYFVLFYWPSSCSFFEMSAITVCFGHLLRR